MTTPTGRLEHHSAGVTRRAGPTRTALVASQRRRGDHDRPPGNRAKFIAKSRTRPGAGTPQRGRAPGIPPSRLPRSLGARGLARRALTAAIEGPGINAESVGVVGALLLW